jgi:4-azaleucine resistance transporter AzlC
MAPILLGVVPFGLVAGVTAVEAGMTTPQAVGMSVILFAGASQLAAIELIGRTAPVAVIVLTALVINLRFVMYSASLAPYLRRASAPARWLSAYVLTDQGYAVSLAEFRETRPAERSRFWYYLGGSLTLWVTWQLSTATGAVAGAAVPDGLSLGFAVPLTFLALLVPALTDRVTLLVAAVSGTVAAVAAVLPLDLGLVTAAVVGVTLGVALDRRAERFPVTDAEADADADAERTTETGGDSP